jgi:hypothetical protein
MKKIVATKAPKFRSETARRLAWAYAVTLIVMAVGQLFAFEKFIPLLQGYQLPGGYGTAATIGSVVVFTEVFALPFLLGMSLSSLMRAMSKAFGVIVPSVWLVLAVHAYITNIIPDNGGMFGSYAPVLVSLQLLLSLIYLVFGLYIVFGSRQLREK